MYIFIHIVMPLFAFIGFLVFLKILALVAVAISGRMQRATYQESFTRGQLPQPKLNDFYPGTSYIFFGVPVPWRGKRFIAAPDGGVNIFSSLGGRLLHVFTPHYKHFSTLPDGAVSAYNFKTTIGAGLRDTSTQVLKLDYNLPENPGIIRIIYDELVQVDPGRYLGKVYVQVLPGWFFFVGFFELKAMQKVSVEPTTTLVETPTTETSVVQPPPTTSAPVAGVSSVSPLASVESPTVKP